MADDATGPLEQATAPARWLLDAGVEGVPLTAMFTLPENMVREAVQRWPGWWHADLFGPPHREADVAVLKNLHQGLRRLKLMRRRGRLLVATPRGRELADDPAALLAVLVADLGRGDRFTTMVAKVVSARLSSGLPCAHDDLVAPALRKVQQGAWHGVDGRPPGERDVSRTVSDVLCRGEAYGLVARQPGPGPGSLHSLIVFTAAALRTLGLDRESSLQTVILVFDAELVNVPGVGARVAVGAGQHLTALHDAIQDAFGWEGDHPYAFWLDGTFWGDQDTEYTSPVAPEGAPQTPDVPLTELDLAVGARVAYVFAFADQWRVRLTLREQVKAEDEPYPRVLERRGTAPSQYPADDAQG